MCFGTWHVFLGFTVRGGRIEGSGGTSTTSKQRIWVSRNQNGPKFVELLKSFPVTQYTGNVLPSSSFDWRAGVVHRATLPNSLRVSVGNVFFMSPPPHTPTFLTGVTQSGKRIKIMCAVTAAVNCKSGNPAYPLPYWGDNKKLCRDIRKRPDPSGVNGKLPMTSWSIWTRFTFSTFIKMCRQG